MVNKFENSYNWNKNWTDDMKALNKITKLEESFKSD